MANYHKTLLYRIFFFSIPLLFALPANAQLASVGSKLRPISVASKFADHYVADTTTTAKDSMSQPRLAVNAITGAEVTYDASSIANVEASIAKAKDRRQLMSYLKQITSDDEVAYNRSHTRFFYGLANVFARLRLYPLAMKCYLKTIAVKDKDLTDTLQQPADAGLMAINTSDDSLLEKRVVLANAPGNKLKDSRPTTYNYISSTLDDGKKAAAYAMLFHVKQPVAGKKRIFVLNNTGHTFITLIKYNVDSTYSSFSFGFYPKKRSLLSATPLVPSDASVFKDDTDHQWDEVLGKFISKRRFEKILLLVKQYDHLEYHLSNNNCTDFGLKAAQLAGIKIDGTTGNWPLGHGNNPAITGQSILEGKYTDADTGTAADLFMNTTVAP